MAELIPPRDDEAITKDGVPSKRFSRYLDGSASRVNASAESAEIDASSINQSAGMVSALANRVAALEQQSGIQSPMAAQDDPMVNINAESPLISSLSSRVAQLEQGAEVSALAIFSALEKRITDIEAQL